MKKYLAALLLVLTAMPGISSDKYKREPFLDIINYSFTVSVSDTSDIIYAKAEIQVLIKNTADSMIFDLRNQDQDGIGMKTDSVIFSKGKIRWVHINNKLIVVADKKLGKGATGIIRIVYHGIPADGLIISRNKFGERTFFSDNWPNRAFNYLPCIDHPYDKATVDFYVIAPSHYVVVGSGCLIEESHLEGNRKITHWKESVPLATKVMAFGAADFDFVLAGTVDTIPVWTYVFDKNREKGFNDYSAGVKPLSFFTSLIGPYSYEKLANVQSKTIFGGLENAGCIFYSEKSVTGLGNDEALMAHEIAHQWFGNSVTENDWNHIWLSEGFATYLTAVYMEMTYGKERLDRIMKSDRNRVINFYLSSPAPVVDTTIHNLMDLLNVNSYQKGSWVLHMLRNELGDETFWRGIKLYYQRFRNQNAMTADFQKVMEEVSGKNLDIFFRQWLYLPGQPDLSVKSRISGEKDQSEVIIEQKQSQLFNFPIELVIKGKRGDLHEKVQVTDRVTKIIVPTGQIDEIIPDPETRLLFRIIKE
jgi:aminopeptidase N